MNPFRVERGTGVAPPSERGRPPSGTVSFLFTDIEGSTERWDRDRDAMQAALRRHDALMHEAIAGAGGYVFKTIGDAFCAAFGSAAAAVGAALAAQNALAAEDFSAVEGVRVRMAIHTGTADERDGDYFGPTVNRVARLLSIGYGGLVLLSGVAADLARHDLPAASELRDLGEHRLRDLSAPEHVFQLTFPEQRATFPALRSLGALHHNLPQTLTDFIGRDREIAEIGALLESSRLVTLFGTGGLGKTRCALQTASAALPRFEHGTWFVDLAPLADPSIVPNQIASVLGLQQSGSRPVLEIVLAHLKNKSVLLILDNCEHLIAEVAQLVSELLRTCPALRILATSR